MKNNDERLGKKEHKSSVPLCGCGVGRKVICKRQTNDNMNHNVTLTWFLKGGGRLVQDGREYIVHDNSVCLRNSEIPFKMDITDDEGPRLFVSISLELFQLLYLLIPELKQMPPVWECPFSQETFDAFFTFYDHMKQISSVELYQVIPDLVRYILLVTGIQQRRNKVPLETGRRFLEENQALSLAEIAEKCGMTYHTFRRQFTETFGIAPGQYRIRKRIEMAALYMKRGKTVSETAELLGYADIYTFSHQFTAVMGISPVKYQKELDEEKE